MRILLCDQDTISAVRGNAAAGEAVTVGQPGSFILQTLPAVGERQIFPGLVAVTMPKANGLEELHVDPLSFTSLIYGRRGRELRSALGKGLEDRRIRARSVMVLPAGLETR